MNDTKLYRNRHVNECILPIGVFVVEYHYYRSYNSGERERVSEIAKDYIRTILTLEIAKNYPLY